jgi:hypothetical protein
MTRFVCPARPCKPPRSWTRGSRWWPLAAVATGRLLLLAGVALVLSACGEPVSVGLGVSEVTPAEVVIEPSLALSGQVVEAQFTFRVSLRNTLDPDGSNSALLCGEVEGLPPGVSANVSANCVQLLSNNDNLDVVVTVRHSANPFAPPPPGRYPVTLEGRLCQSFDATPFSADDSACATATARWLVVVTGAPVPDAPQGLTAQPTASSVSLHWAASSQPDSYDIERATAAGPFVFLTSLTAPAEAYADQGLTPQTDYRYRVTPRNQAGVGAAAEVATTTLSVSDPGLVLTLVVPEGGRVGTQPAGLDCVGPATCTASFPRNTAVTLVNTPAAGWRFSRYNGDAPCASGTIELSQDTQCGAVFEMLVPMRVWAQIGDALQPSNALAPALVVDTLDQPTVAYANLIGGGARQWLVERFDRTASPPRWLRYGTAPLNAGGGIAPAELSMVMAPNNRPLLAWINGSQLQAALWGGSTFDTLSSLLNVSGVPGPVLAPRVAMQGSVITVAWVEVTASATQQRVGLKRYDEAAPQAGWIGGFVTPETRVQALHLALDGQGRAHLLVFTAGAPGVDGPVHLWREDASAGGGWLQLCGDLPFPGPREFASNSQKGAGLTFSGNDPVAVVNDGTRVLALRCDGSSWQGLGSGSGEIAAAAAGQSIAAVAVPQGRYTQPLVAVARYITGSATTTRVDVQSWNGSAWLPAGEPYTSDRNVAQNQMAVSGSASRPQLALADRASSSVSSRLAVWEWVP